MRKFLFFLGAASILSGWFIFGFYEGRKTAPKAPILIYQIPETFCPQAPADQSWVKNR